MLLIFGSKSQLWVVVSGENLIPENLWLSDRLARVALINSRPLRAGWGRLGLGTASQEGNCLGKLVQ